MLRLSSVVDRTQSFATRSTSGELAICFLLCARSVHGWSQKECLTGPYRHSNVEEVEASLTVYNPRLAKVKAVPGPFLSQDRVVAL